MNRFLHGHATHPDWRMALALAAAQVDAQRREPGAAAEPTLGWVYLGRVFRGIALGGGTLIWMLGPLYYARSRETAPIYLGIHTVLTGFRWLVAPFAGVLLKQAFGQSARPIFLISFVVILASALLMIREARRQPRRPSPEEGPMPAPREIGA